MFIKASNDRWINLNYCRQIEIFEQYGKSTIILRSGIRPQNSYVQSSFFIGYFESREKARKCVANIFKAHRENRI